MHDFKEEYKKANEDIAPSSALLEKINQRAAFIASEPNEKNVFIHSFGLPLKIASAAACAVLAVGTALLLPRLLGSSSLTANEATKGDTGINTEIAYNSSVSADMDGVCEDEADETLNNESEIFVPKNYSSLEEAIAGETVTKQNDSASEDHVNATSSSAPASESVQNEAASGETGSDADLSGFIIAAEALCSDIFSINKNSEYSFEYCKAPDGAPNLYPNADAFIKITDARLKSLNDLNRTLGAFFTDEAAKLLVENADTIYFEQNGQLFAALEQKKEAQTSSVDVIDTNFSEDGTTVLTLSDKSLLKLTENGGGFLISEASNIAFFLQ